MKKIQILNILNNAKNIEINDIIALFPNIKNINKNLIVYGVSTGNFSHTIKVMYLGLCFVAKAKHDKSTDKYYIDGDFHINPSKGARS